MSNMRRPNHQLTMTRLGNVYYNGRALLHYDRGCVELCVYLFAKGWCMSDISRHVRRTKATVSNILKRVFSQGGISSPRQGGRRQDRFGLEGRKTLLALVRKCSGASNPSLAPLTHTGGDLIPRSA